MGDIVKVEEILTGGEGEKLFLLGNEAAVRGALESGVGLASTYPGTPSSEIGNVLSRIAKEAGIYFEFSSNEKVALEVSAAAAASGLRSFVFMKCVGLNVAADPFMSSIYTGVRGGMVILVADDPSMYSSQNEQDDRLYARISGSPLLEPSNPQEMKESIKFAFDLSEKFSLPVLVRTTTRVSHMRGVVELGQIKKGKTKSTFETNPSQFVVLPANARRMRRELIQKVQEIEQFANNCELNRIIDKGGDSGIITSGGSFNYVMDILDEYKIPAKVLKLTLSYPFPEKLVREFLNSVKQLAVVEEVEPIMEKEVLSVIGKYGMEKKVFGKLDGTFPRALEYTPDIVRESLGKFFNLNLPQKEWIKSDIPLPSRPPILCPGCPHRATYYALKEAVKNLGIKNVIYPTDIGCYILGASPPYGTADYLLCMGSSTGAGCGFARATGQKVISFIGDSTFFHAGIPGLINAVHNKDNFTLVIMDNRTTAMTGGQPYPGVPIDGMGDIAPEVSIEKIVTAIGVGFVTIIDPYNVKKAEKAFAKALQYKGVAVIIAKHPCALITAREQKKKGIHITFDINQDKCNKCMMCITDFACPAIYVADSSVHIDSTLCVGCGVCTQVCPENAVEVGK